MSATATAPNRSGVATNVGSAGEALGLWEPKRALTLEAARAHTHRIKIMRYVLLAFSVAIVIALLAQFASDRGGGVDIDTTPDESVKMVNPRYSGRTSDGLPFYLTADTATQTVANRNTVALVNPVLEFVRDTQAQSSFLVAKTGSYDEINKILSLRQDVNLETDDGYVCNTTHARIFAGDKRIEGDEPISCAGNFGRVDGQTFAIEDAYTTFIFKDGMTAQIISDADAPAENDFGFGGDGPIAIQAERGTYRGRETELRGAVRVEQDGAVVTSDVMDIFRGEGDSAAAASRGLGLGAIETIDARDNFRYLTEDNDIRGNRGVYDRPTQTMTVTGNVTVAQAGGERAEAQKLVYDTASQAVRLSGNGGDRIGLVIPGSEPTPGN